MDWMNAPVLGTLGQLATLSFHETKNITCGEGGALVINDAALIDRAEQQLCAEYAEVTLWVLEDNPRARAFYEHAGWSVDGGRKAEARWGVRAPEVRYRKRFIPEPG